MLRLLRLSAGTVVTVNSRSLSALPELSPLLSSICCQLSFFCYLHYTDEDELFALPALSTLFAL